MRIKDLPWFNRPGFKLTNKGVNFLDDAELLSIIFGIETKKESALELSNKLLKKYNLNRLEELSVKISFKIRGSMIFTLQILSKPYLRLV